MLLHAVIDHLVDDFVPALQQLDEDLDAIEERVFAGPKHEQLEDIFRMKRQLVGLRRVLAPQRELLARVTSGGAELPGMTIEVERHSGTSTTSLSGSPRRSTAIVSWRTLRSTPISRPPRTASTRRRSS